MKRISIIQLDDEFKLQADPYCWILTRETFGETNPKTGKPKLSCDVSYHANLRSALTKYLDFSSKPSSEVLEVFTRLSTAEQNIANALKNVEGKRIGYG